MFKTYSNERDWTGLLVDTELLVGTELIVHKY